MFGFTYLDGIAFVAFIIAWIAYHLMMEGGWAERRSFNRRMDTFRQQWMQRMLARDNRIVDAQIVAALQNGTAFFASTSLLAIGATLAILQSTDAVMAIFADLPFVEPNRTSWEVKTLGLTIIFANAFFKFAWAYRLFNYTTILLGSTPPARDAATPEAQAHARKAARMATLAGRHFNRGQRAFFFALAYLGWYINGWAFMITTFAIFMVMMNRQFGKDAQWILDDDTSERQS
ncbi:DUF599 domain-containing protein [Ancylobacter radicis]|uniref:DUF599 family protein n=1 Tax=Ancylobacter radicis TaxID=2836179 RepID=A0ABS5R4N2_9HYPH|nr:DUF599 family protein [Ancylobacter radicis]MBS9476635.1 DUF599 family protein [Ancylobacter radicis]